MKTLCSTFLLVLFYSFSGSAFTITSVISHVSCNGGSDGAININPVGGTAPYTYSWSNGAGTEDLDSLAAGTYTVTVTDAALATQTGTYTVTENLGLQINGNAYPVTCFGGNNGSINFSVTGGSGAYNYSINGSAPVSMQALTENYQWVRQGSSTSTGSVDNKALGIATDKNGNVFITGEFYGTLTLGHTSLVSAAAGTSDLFIAKYSPSGTLIWAQRTGGIGYDSGFGIATDTSGNVLVTGRFRNTASFGSFTLTSSSTDDLFVAKYDPNGNCLWVMHPTGTNNDYGWAITTDQAGNSYISGNVIGNITFPGLPVMTGTSALNILTAKIDPNGTPLWAKRSGGTGNANQGSAIALDNSGNVYITGYFTNNLTLGSFTVTSAGMRDVFIAKYNNTGTEQWLRSGGGTADDYGLGICTDKMDNVYATGYFRNSINFGSGAITAAAFADDMFVVKYNSSGTAQWSQRAGASMNDRGMAISSDEFNNVYITGYYIGAATFSSITAPTASINSVYVARYNSAGTIQMVKEVFASGGSEGYGIHCDKKGSIYACGFFKGNANFGSIPMTSGGVCDLFASRFSMTNAADTLLNLSAGNYSIALSDFSGCTTTGTFTVSQPTAINPVVITAAPLCYGENGSASLAISGGTAPYTEDWGSADPMALPEGNYTVTVSDSLGCDTTVSISILAPPLLNTSLTANPELCYGQCNGTAYASASGGTGSYSYLWSNSSSNDSISNLCPGNYTVIVSDANNCKDTSSVMVIASTEIISTAIITGISCSGVCDASVSLTVAGGSPGYSYMWCNGNTTPASNGLCSGICHVLITDNNGCSITDTVIINSPAPLLISTSTSADTICPGACASLSVAAAGGTAGYTYLWAPSSSLNNSTIYDPTACPPGSTTYTITVTDMNGCVTVDSQTVNVALCTDIAKAEETALSVFPNPFHSSLSIRLDHFTSCSVSIYNSLGQIIFRKEMKTGQQEINTEQWDNGLYMIELSDGSFNKRQKLLKH